jgi:hypothetical protein
VRSQYFPCAIASTTSTGEPKKLQAVPEKTTPLGGKMMMVVEAFNHRPVATWYNPEAKANDKSFAEKLLKRLPTQGLLIFDLGLVQK